jgi:uroporphyrinogen decarboxylase
MRKETLSPRERWLPVLTRQKPDRIPMDYQATPEATEKLLKHVGCSTLEEVCIKLHIDRRIGVAPQYVGPTLPKNTDAFGCGYTQINYGTGSYEECSFHPLAHFTSLETLIREYRWPSIDSYSVDYLPKFIKDIEHQPLVCMGSEPYLFYCYLRGQEQAMMDFVEYPDIAHYCLEKLFDLCYQKTQRIYEAIPGKVLLTYVAEDMGSQEGLMFSPAHIREFLLPHMKRMIDLVHSAGAYVFHHNDGAIRAILPDMITAGIDILDPVQWRCVGMERSGLKKDFGNSVIFHGAVDNQQTLPFGTVADVQQEVIENIQILGKNGGYVLGPCHNIQPVGPAENVVAMYETGYEYGW